MEKDISNVIIVHGSNENQESAEIGGRENTRHWHPWIKRELEKLNINVSGELYPEDWNPKYSEWKQVFEKNQIDQNTILIGHSAGCAFILHWLMENNQKVDKIILVAPYIKDDGIATWLKEFVDFHFDVSLKKKYAKLIIFYDKQDLPGVVESVNIINRELSPEIIELNNRGHFTKDDMGTEEFPELLEKVLNT